jgi:uncharacterized membrane protein
MSTVYNLIAGHSVERLAALSDGVFAVAMTLLVLDLHVPASRAIHTELGLWGALVALSPSLITYFMSFLTLGIFWVGHQTQLNHLARSNRNFAWINLGFLLVVSLMPFSTALLAAFSTYRIALAAYWLNMLLFGTMAFGGWQYAWRAGLVKDDTTVAMRSAVERRIVIGQALYALGAGLCVVST